MKSSHCAFVFVAMALTGCVHSSKPELKLRGVQVLSRDVWIYPCRQFTSNFVLFFGSPETNCISLDSTDRILRDPDMRRGRIIPKGSTLTVNKIVEVGTIDSLNYQLAKVTINSPEGSLVAYAPWPQFIKAIQ